MPKRTPLSVASRKPILYPYASSFVILNLASLFLNLNNQKSSRIHNFHPSLGVVVPFVILEIIYNGAILYLLASRNLSTVIRILNVMLVLNGVALIFDLIDSHLISLITSLLLFGFTYYILQSVRTLENDPTYKRQQKKKPKPKKHDWLIGT